MKTEAPTVGHFFFAIEKVMSSPPFKFSSCPLYGGEKQKAIRSKSNSELKKSLFFVEKN